MANFVDSNSMPLRPDAFIMNQSKPPLITIQPPPLPVSVRSEEENNNVRWLIAAAVAIGLLIALIFMGMLVVADIGGGNDSSGNGGSGRIVAASLASNDGEVTGLADATSPTSGKTQQESVGEEAQATDGVEIQADAKKPSSDVEPDLTPGSDEKEGEISNSPTESMLLIYEAKPVPPQTSAQRNKASASMAGGGKAADLAAKGGSNPFIGDGAPAKSTVFVIDVSGSMQNQDRLPRVVSSMKHAIEKLKSDQKFTVILFDSSFHTPPHGASLLLANQKNKNAIFEWLDIAPGGGGTNPSEAMTIAIQEKPERIVLLSDGEFDPYCVDAITQANQANRKQSRIDCVGLIEEVETLKEIANQNSGTYYQAY